MTKIAITLCLCVSFLSYSQKIKGKWKTADVLWNEASKEYSLMKIKNKRDYFYYFGNFIEFKDDNTFISHYSSPCGNDCFPTAKGTYRLIDKKKVELTVHEISKQGPMCKEIYEKGEWKLGTYLISKEKTGLKLTKK